MKDENYKTVRLGDVCEIVTGSTPTTKKDEYYTSNDIPFIKPSDLPMEYISYLDKSEFYISESARSVARIIPKDSILVSCIGIIGKVGINTKEVAFNQQINALVPNKELIDFNFLANSIISKKKLMAEKANAAVVPIINKTDFSNLQIPLPPLATQKHIAAVLDKCTALIAKHKLMLEKYDTLVKSQFVEMFGDPVQNPMGWEVKSLGEYIETANNGLARRGNDKDGKIVLRLVELQRGKIDYSNVNRISIKESEEKYLLKENDILFARVNGNPENVGRCAFYKNIGEQVYHNDHIIRIHFFENKLNEYFLNTLLNSDYGKSEFKKYIKTSAGQYTIAQEGIASAKIPVPPLALQQKFAAFVQKVDAQKAKAQKSLEKAETLYKALMQEYFG